ncbi:ABC transporter permease [Pseudoalteromonas sp. JBTF-M23]|uniref:ABC transporter permease n=1 Tax=Pseudoalteromonas caenipelagi TaxID=2726988 RepID=A0A849VCB0_9GAMM|nr:ABC transporter permease [Pseudoalteromonas caenipelagi]NOU51012.1 ABC transporter permease [Pseudoalteromonas caenipelagi]
MSKYYLRLAWISLYKSPILSALMILIIAIGIATSMVAYTVTDKISKHPIEHKADTILRLYLSSWNLDQPYKEHQGKEEAPNRISYRDAVNLTKVHQESDLVNAQTLVAEHKAQTRTASQTTTQAKMRFMYTVNNTFFSMFDSPFLYGAPWSDEADVKGKFTIVISKVLNDELFNGQNSVGKHIILDDHVFTISGVLDTWAPVPKFFGYASFAFQRPHDLYIPFTTRVNAGLYSRNAFTYQCPQYPEEATFELILNSECVWSSMWVELNQGEDRQAYHDLINRYDAQQKQLGRFPRALPSYTRTIEEYFVVEGVVPEYTGIARWIAFAFLVVCLLNCMSLLINKFHNKKGEIGLRRAIGASKQDIAFQFASETALLGLLGGIAGLVLAQLGLSGAQQAFSFLNDSIMQMDNFTLAMTLLFSIGLTCLFGLWPVYNAMHVQPSSQLKNL